MIEALIYQAVQKNVNKFTQLMDENRTRGLLLQKYSKTEIIQYLIISKSRRFGIYLTSVVVEIGNYFLTQQDVEIWKL